MRYIQKGEEPESLTQYKKNKNAYFDGYSNKDDVRENLLKEQGYLCGYCMRRLKQCSDVKIEHIVPQSVLGGNERETLNYKIMLGVCYGNAKKGRPYKCLTCDAHRKNADLNINPFDENCIKKIKYKSDGRIYSEDKEIDTDLNDTLNLNYDGEDAYLVKNRREVLEACRQKLERMQKMGIYKRSLLEKMLCEYEERDENGQLKPYSGIVIWYLNKKLHK